MPFLVMVTAFYLIKYIDYKPKKLILLLIFAKNVHGIIRNEVFQTKNYI
jgi:hypothetical protein